MILFTGGGAFYTAFEKLEPCRYVSLRGTDDVRLGEELRQATVVIHNAASLNCPAVEDAVRDNFLPTLRLVKLCLRHNPEVKLIHLGSMSCLASDTEYLPAEEMSPYAYSKFLGETFCLKSSLPNAWSVRFSTLFYQNPQRDGLSKLVADAATAGVVTIWNGGTARRDFIPLDVAAEYVAKLAKQPTQDRILNIAAARPTSFGEVVGFLKKRLPGLTVNDLPVAASGREVLADFSDRGIRQLGVVEFSLEEKIGAYLRQFEPVSA